MSPADIYSRGTLARDSDSSMFRAQAEVLKKEARQNHYGSRDLPKSRTLAC